MWQVTLSDNTTVRQDKNNLGHWRELAERCKRDGLGIYHLYYNDKEIEMNAEAHCIFYDVLVPNIYINTQLIRLGIASYHKSSNRTRIRWFHISGNIPKPLLATEIHKGLPEFLQEGLIKHVQKTK